MASIFRDGFDSYNGIATAGVGLFSKYTDEGTNPSLTTGRFGTGQALSNSSASSCSAPFDSAASSLTIHGGIKITAAPAAGQARSAIALMSVTTWMVGLQFFSDGSIGGRRQTSTTASTSLGTTAAGIYTADQWYTFALEIVISDTVGRITLYLDDWVTPVLNLTGVDTRNGAPTDVDRIFFNTASSSCGFDVDDVYITNSATRITAPIRCDTLNCDSDGGTLNWTPSTGSDHFAVVDEVLATTADYLQASTVGNVDELGLGNLADTPTSIEEVCVVGYLNKTDGTARSANLGVNSGGTTADSGNLSLVNGGKRHEYPRATDPNTAAAWGASAVNALKVRVKVAV